MIMQVLAAMMGTLGFVILFDTPKKEYLFCVLGGGWGWMAYLILEACGADAPLASLGSALILTLTARILSAIRRCPATVFLVTGIFTLVPGAGIYYTAYHLLMNDLAQFTFKGVETFKVAGAITLGIVFGSAIPQSWFARLSRAVHERSGRKST